MKDGENGEKEKEKDGELADDHKEDLHFRVGNAAMGDSANGIGDGDLDSDANRGSDYDALPEDEDIPAEEGELFDDTF